MKCFEITALRKKNQGIEEELLRTKEELSQTKEELSKTKEDLRRSQHEWLELYRQNRRPTKADSGPVSPEVGPQVGLMPPFPHSPAVSPGKQRRLQETNRSLKIEFRNLSKDNRLFHDLIDTLHMQLRNVNLVETGKSVPIGGPVSPAASPAASPAESPATSPASSPAASPASSPAASPTRQPALQEENRRLRIQNQNLSETNRLLLNKIDTLNMQLRNLVETGKSVPIGSTVPEAEPAVIQEPPKKRRGRPPKAANKPKQSQNVAVASGNTKTSDVGSTPTTGTSGPVSPAASPAGLMPQLKVTPPSPNSSSDEPSWSDEPMSPEWLPGKQTKKKSSKAKKKTKRPTCKVMVRRLSLQKS